MKLDYSTQIFKNSEIDAEEGTYFMSCESICFILRPLSVMGREENEVRMAWISVRFLEQKTSRRRNDFITGSKAGRQPCSENCLVKRAAWRGGTRVLSR
jgi:hypothetical protein